MIQPIETREGPDLSIHLLDPTAPLYPGSVIRGHVTRKTHIVAASATVRICLIGDSAARLQVQQGRSVVILGAGFEFWGRNAVSQVVHRGPVHIAPDSDSASQTWPFTLVIPKHTDGKALNSGLRKIEREASYLRAPEDPNGKQPLPEQPLPATWGMNVCDGYGFVEYYLEAEILVEGKKMEPIEATLPVRVLSRPAPALIADFELQGMTTEGCVTSHRLALGMEHAELTFNQKRQMFLGSKRVPAWHFNLRVECASVIQLGNPASIPFRLKVTPDRAKSSEILQDVPQKPTLMTLPREIRDSIYEFYVAADGGYVCNPERLAEKILNQRRNEASLDVSGIFQRADLQPIDLNLSYTCKIAAQEMSGVALRVNTITFSTVTSAELRVLAERFNHLMIKRFDGDRDGAFRFAGFAMPESERQGLKLKYPQFAPLLDRMKQEGNTHPETRLTTGWDGFVQWYRTGGGRLRSRMGPYGEAPSLYRTFQKDALTAIATSEFGREQIERFWRETRSKLFRLVSAPRVAECKIEHWAVPSAEDMQFLTINQGSNSSSPDARYKPKYRYTPWAMDSAQVTHNVASWVIEALALEPAGMPSGSFSLLLDGQPVPWQCTQVFQLIVQRDAAWQAAWLLSLDRGILPSLSWFDRKGELRGSRVPDLPSEKWPQALRDIAEGSSIVRCNFDVGDSWDVEKIVEDHRQWTVQQWMEGLGKREPSTWEPDAPLPNWREIIEENLVYVEPEDDVSSTDSDNETNSDEDDS
ncbi:hypothetical protein K4K51_003419 [Colletotrichum sp. SAR 10_75]|nr:hypothetical protein K4K51_003419 [Colletotrichum sp. SAR 10_75]